MHGCSWQVMQGKLERKTPSPTTSIHMVSGQEVLCVNTLLPPPPTHTPQDAFSENSKHLQKAFIAYLNRRSDTDPSCAVSLSTHRDYTPPHQTLAPSAIVSSVFQRFLPGPVAEGHSAGAGESHEGNGGGHGCPVFREERGCPCH